MGRGSSSTGKLVAGAHFWLTVACRSSKSGQGGVDSSCKLEPAHDSFFCCPCHCPPLPTPYPHRDRDWEVPGETRLPSSPSDLCGKRPGSGRCWTQPLSVQQGDVCVSLPNFIPNFILTDNKLILPTSCMFCNDSNC